MRFTEGYLSIFILVISLLKYKMLRKNGQVGKKNVALQSFVIMNPKEKNLILKKCASTNELGILTSANLNLREAKSYAGTMVDTKLYDTIPNQRYQNTKENSLELFCKDYDLQRTNKNAIATKDAVTDEIYYINEEFLVQKGKAYASNDIAWTWKKDCRMWLWKNTSDFKKNRSVAEMKKRSAT